MTFKGKNPRNKHKKSLTNTEIRKKLGVTQVQLAAMLKVSRAYVSLTELNIRSGNPAPNTTLSKIFFHFHELETGKQSAYRSLETKLLLNDEYKKILPKMKAVEMECRYKLAQLKGQLNKMKERARDAEHAIIVFTKAIDTLKENDQPAEKTENEILGLNLLKEQAYTRLLACWEPEQAKLHARLEAVAGQARAFKRYRLKITRAHNPFKQPVKQMRQYK